mgnify:CR=1 FL=1
MNVRKKLLRACQELTKKSSSSGVPVEVGLLYQIAGMLTQAQLSQAKLSFTMSEEGIQEIFSKHFTFLVKHSIDLMDHDSEQ